MIRFKVKDLLAKMSALKRERVRLEDVAQATGIHRVTLSNMNSPKGFNTTTDNLDRLCHYFGCQIQDLVEYIPSEPPPPRTRARKSGNPAAPAGPGN